MSTTERSVDYPGEASQHQHLVGMFAAISPQYDLVNHVITWGFDRRWRLLTAKECLASQPGKVLDLCCGTGSLAIAIARLAKEGVGLIGVDYSRPMLAIAAKKAELLAKDSGISFIYGEADRLPFPEGYFDCIGISFAFRNLTHKNPLAKRHIAEILRLLKVGGKCVIVETSQPKNRLIRKLFHWYLRWLVYRLGYLLSGSRAAYRYLTESVTRFYSADELKGLLLGAGFNRVSFRPFFGGAVGIYVVHK